MTFGAAVELSVAMPLSWLPADQRLYPGGREAGEGHGGQRDRLRTGELLDVCDRHGCGDLLPGRPILPQIMVKAGLGYRGAADHHLFHRDDNFPGRLLCRSLQRVHFLAKLKGNHVAIAVTVIGTIAAILFPDG